MQKKSQKAVLLIHGFTATPESMDTLKLALEKKGFFAEAPLLPGHGTTPQDLNLKTWQDWYACVKENFLSLQDEYGEVSIAGLSLGGLLTLMAAIELPVHKIAVLAAPVFFTGFLSTVVLPFVGETPLQHLYPYHPKFLGSAIKDPEAAKKFISYPKMPVKGIMELVKLQKIIQERVHEITAPSLLLYSRHDTVSPYENLKFLVNHLGSKEIRPVTLENSNHVITMDYDKNIVCEEVVKFFSK